MADNRTANAQNNPRQIFTFLSKNVLICGVLSPSDRIMYQLKPGSLAMVIGARTAVGRNNIGKSVELFGLCQPGERFINPVNGVETQLPSGTGRALWLVTGDVVSFDRQRGFAFVRAEHLMPLDSLRETAGSEAVYTQ